MSIIKWMIADLIFITSCKSGYYYHATPFAQEKSRSHIILDDSYVLFTREGFLDETSTGRKQLNASQTRITANGKRIEVEYMLISQKWKRCLYIATVPDKYRNWYENHFMQDTINLYDARVFYYGEWTPDNKVIFCGKSTVQDKDVWTLVQQNESITISEIREYKNGELVTILSMKDALKDPLTFTKSNSYTLGYKNDNEKNTTFNEIAKSENAVFIDENKRGKYAIYFEMSKPVNGFTHLKFPDKRVWYKPLP